jgi:hypothetical protein
LKRIEAERLKQFLPFSLNSSLIYKTAFLRSRVIGQVTQLQQPAQLLSMELMLEEKLNEIDLGFGILLRGFAWRRGQQVWRQKRHHH